MNTKKLINIGIIATVVLTSHLWPMQTLALMLAVIHATLFAWKERDR